MNTVQGIAHDMRAPLAAMDALCALMERHVSDPQALLHDVRRMRTACAQLMQLASQFLAGEETALCPVPCTVEEMVLPAAALYEERVDVKMTGECAAKVLADTAAVRRILVNLLSNAAKYSQGRILLCTYAIRRGSSVYLRVEVKDFGPGMSEKTLAGLFCPGVRGEEAAGTAGYGIGLSAAQALARRMGGNITAASCPGRGSVFAFEAAFALAEGASLAGKRFLVAEDSALARDALCELLELHGAQVIAAADGKTAVEAFTKSPEGHFDALLLDVMMPGMDGFSAAQAIRAMDRPDAKPVRMVALTGAVSQAVLDKAAALSMRYAVKPLTMEQLAQMMNG